LLFGIALSGLIIVAGYVAARIFEVTDVPDILMLIALGIIVGPVLGFVDASSLTQAMPFFAALALVVIMLMAGQRFNFSRVISILPSNSVFSVLAYFFTSALITCVAYFGFGWPLLHAAFLAFILSDTCPTVVGALVDRLRASESTKISISLEASISGALSSVCAILVLRFLSAQSLDASGALHTLAAAFTIAVVAGVIAGFAWNKLVQALDDKSFEYVLTLAAALILYAAVEFIGGNGAISVLSFGVVLGSYGELSRIIHGGKQAQQQKSTYVFQDEVVFFVRTFFFVYVGIVFQFNVPLAIFLLSVAALACILCARVVSMKLLSPNAQDYLLQAFVIPTGLSAVVLSFLPSAWGVSIPGITQVVLFIVVFTNVVTAIAVYLHHSSPIKPARAAPASQRPRIVGFAGRPPKAF